MSDYLHGVEQFLLENRERPIEVLSASVIGLVAIADDANDEIFPLNEPVLVNSEEQIKHAGSTGTLSHALHDIYRQCGALVIVVRVEQIPLHEKKKSDNTQETKIVGTVDPETGAYSGIQSLLFAESKLGIRPRLLIAPELSHVKAVGIDLERIAKKLNAVAIIDGSGAGYSTVLNEIRDYQDVFFVNCGIQVLGHDGTIQKRAASATIAGLIVRVDHEKGYWHSPSSHKIYGILGTVEPIDHTIGSKTSRANLYNSHNVAVIVNQKGGWYLYGNRLANGAMLPHQRIRYTVGDSIVYAHQQMVDNNITKQYVEGVQNNVNKLLRRLKAREVISGGRCWSNREHNIESIGTGQVHWDYEIGFFDVAERLTFRQHITDRYNTSIFE